MKAIICRQFRSFEDLEYGAFRETALGPGEIRVQVKAAALGFAEMLMVQGGYQIKPPLPFVPGYDAAGVVVEVAPDVRGIAVRQRGVCGATAGSYAERGVASAAAAFPLADGVDFEAAAAHFGAYGTAYYALAGRAAL